MAWNNLGGTYAGLNQHAKAIEAFQEALRLKPDYAAAWFNLGVAYASSGNRVGARPIYQRLEKLNPVLAEKYLQAVIPP